MPTIIITEKQQAVAAANAGGNWAVEAVTRRWEPETDYRDGYWAPADEVHFTVGHWVRFDVIAEFYDGDFIHAKLVHTKIDFAGTGGLQPVVQSVEETADWSTFLGWVADSEALFAALP
jgi:hypothetical protein